MIPGLMRDLSFAARQLRKNPGFALTAFFVLTLGIAASSAIFAFVDATLVRPLPYRESSKLVALYESIPVGDRYHISDADYLDWKRLNHSFAALDVYQSENLTIAGPGGMEQARAAHVSAGFFRTLGVVPKLGRYFTPGEDLPSAPQTVLLSNGSWRRRFGADRYIIGKTLTLDGASYQVIGVLPAAFHFAPLQDAEFWVAHREPCGDQLGRECHRYYGIARLKDGVSLGTAQAELQGIARQIAIAYPNSNRDRGATVLPLDEVILGRIRPILITLLSGAGLLLLIGFVNVASLLLARAESRRHEIAVRGALGASPGRLMRQFAVEAFLLTAAGCTAGLALGAAITAALARQFPSHVTAAMPWLEGLRFNSHVFLFAVAVSALGGALFAITPAVPLLAGSLQHGLLQGERTVTSKGWRSLAANLVAAELAIALILLVSAGLLGRSFWNLLHTDIGIAPEHLFVLHVQIPSDWADEQSVLLEQQVRSRMAVLPWVVSVGTSYRLPIGTGDYFAHFRVAGRIYVGQGDEENYLSASVGYFETVRATLNRGRFFTEADDASRPWIAIINQAMADQLFPGENPVGKHIICQYSKDHPMEIVGVIKNIKEEPLDVETRGAVYTAFKQIPDNEFFVTVRASRSDEGILPSMIGVVHQLDSHVIVDGAETMQSRIDDTQSAYLHRSAAWIVTGFAAIALLLAAVGMYGLIAFSVGRRTREVGVRMALGAQRGSIYRLILFEGGRLVAVGIVGGVICSFAVTTLLRSLLFGISQFDPATLAAVILVLAGVALLATYIPARRAASIDPAKALRAE